MTIISSSGEASWNTRPKDTPVNHPGAKLVAPCLNAACELVNGVEAAFPFPEAEMISPGDTDDVHTGDVMRPTKARSRFTRLTKWTAHAAGRPPTFTLAVAIILLWAITGPLFQFSDTWQLVINTGTTIVTFLMVFLIQATQNRDGEAVQVKLDEIIRSIGQAKNELLDLEELEEADLELIRDEYREIAKRARHETRK